MANLQLQLNGTLVTGVNCSLSILFLFTGVWHSRGAGAQNPASACPLLYPSSVAFLWARDEMYLPVPITDTCQNCPAELHVKYMDLYHF